MAVQEEEFTVSFRIKAGLLYTPEQVKKALKEAVIEGNDDALLSFRGMVKEIEVVEGDAFA